MFRSSNFIKGGNVVVQKTSSVQIDTNEAIQRRLEEIRILEEAMQPGDSDGFSEGLDPLQVAELVGDSEGEGITPEEAEAAREQAAHLRMEAEEASNRTLEEANAEASRILKEANDEADMMRQDAFSKGYEEGRVKGEEEGRIAGEAVFKAKCEELVAKEEALEKEYQQKVSSMEATLVDALGEIYSHVLGITLTDEKELVLNLLSKTMQTLDTSRNYMIHVPRADVAVVREKKSYLSRQSGIPEENLEIIEDNTLPEKGCLIESDSGIYDCSLGTQLELLTRQLRLISYEKSDN